VGVIQSFGDQATADVYHGTNSRAARTLPKELWPAIRRKLDMVNAAKDLGDLKAPPGNQLEALKGNQKGRHSIRVNKQYRITFRFEGSGAHDVRCEDYHY
jgi:proteic killer suppression protein